MNEENKRAMNEFLKEQKNIETIKKYYFVKEARKHYDDKSIEKIYSMNISDIIKAYNEMDEREKGRLEKKIAAQIAAGEINLSELAETWRGEAQKDKDSTYKTENSDGEER